MDLSKLPKLSQTPPAPQQEPSADESPVMPPHRIVPDYVAAPQPAVGSVVWVNTIIGLVLIYMGWNFARYVGMTATGQPFHTNVTWQVGPKAGQEVKYFELQGYTAWSDFAMFLFGLVILLEAAVKVLAVSKPGPWIRPAVGLALLLTLACTALNLVLLVAMLSGGFGIGLFSVLAVAFGGYIASDEWQMLQSTMPQTA